MATAISICNMALAHLGITNRITAFTDGSEEARYCAVFYDVDRQHVLESFPWNFACKYETLSLVSGGDPQGYSYAYELPSDCIRARKIYNESYSSTGEIDFKVVVGGELWTDQEDVILEYTKDEEVENLFSPTFITALSHKIASDLAMPLAGKSKLQQNELTAYFGFLSVSAGSNAGEGLDRKKKTDDFVAARG